MLVSYHRIRIRRFYIRHRLGMLACASIVFLCLALAAVPTIQFAGASNREPPHPAIALANGK